MNVAPARIVPPVIPCVCVCVRAIIPMGESTNTSNSQDLLLYTDTFGFKLFMMIYDESLRIWICFGFTLFFSWFCWIVFEYVWIYIYIFKNTPNIRLKPDGLWTSLQLPTILQNPHASLPGKFSRTSPTFPGATLWPALVFHLLGIDGRGIGISDDFWFLGCDMGLKENEKNYICHIKQYKTYIHHIV